MRRHGLQAPLDPHQLASWIVFFSIISGVYAFYVPFVEDTGVRWFLVALYSVLVVAIVTLDLYTSYLDPSDPGLTGATDGEFFCGLCQASVARSSKHCRACDRCVEGFDHHCKWLNNCVGARNYWYFFVLISSTVSLLVMQVAWGLWLFIRSFTEKAEMQGLVADKYGKSVMYMGWQAALAIYMALLLTAVIMLGELFIFHVILISKGLTTYDYIIAQRDAKLAAPPKPSSSNMKACRSSRIADTATAKRKVRVGLNPCAAIRTSKPPGRSVSYDAALKIGKSPSTGASTASSSPATAAPAAIPSPTSGDNPVLGKAGSGSFGSVSCDGKEGLEISDKATAGSMRELVAMAVAEQTMLNPASPQVSGNLRGTAVLSSPIAAGPPNTPGCVPECGDSFRQESTTAASVSSLPSCGKQEDFTPLEQSRAGGDAVVPTGASASPSGRQQLTNPGGVAAGRAERQAGGNFDTVAAAGKHLGGHPASPRAVSESVTAATCSITAAPLSKGNSLPPLHAMPTLSLAPGGPGSRSLMFPGRPKSRSPSGLGTDVQRGLSTTPE